MAWLDISSPTGSALLLSRMWTRVVVKRDPDKVELTGLSPHVLYIAQLPQETERTTTCTTLESTEATAIAGRHTHVLCPFYRSPPRDSERGLGGMQKDASQTSVAPAHHFGEACSRIDPDILRRQRGDSAHVSKSCSSIAVCNY